jgi:hypothetical protein
MKKFFFGLAAVPFLAGVASAAEPLGDAQMDRITAGFTPIPCPSSTCSTSTGGFVITVDPSLSASVNLHNILQSYYTFLAAKGFNPGP